MTKQVEIDNFVEMFDMLTIFAMLRLAVQKFGPFDSFREEFCSKEATNLFQEGFFETFQTNFCPKKAS